MRMFIVFILVVFAAQIVSAQTATPTLEPTATNTSTPTSPPWVYSTIAPVDGTPEGTMTRFDYVTTAADVHIANLLTWILYSIWGFFLFTLVVFYRRRK